MTKSRKRAALRGMIAVLGALFLALGLAMGQYGETLNKAVYLCMECIGIG